MDTKKDEAKKKRSSKGMRKHIRRVKQEARKNNVPGQEVKKDKRPS